MLYSEEKVVGGDGGNGKATNERVAHQLTKSHEEKDGLIENTPRAAVVKVKKRMRRTGGRMRRCARRLWMTKTVKRSTKGWWMTRRIQQHP